MSVPFSLLSPQPLPLSLVSLPLSSLYTHRIYQTLPFRKLRAQTPLSIRTFYKFPKPLFALDSQLSDADDDDDEAAEEYDDISGEVSEGIEEEDDDSEDETEDSADGDGDVIAPELKSTYEEFKWQRVERLCNEVKLFGEEIINIEELKSIYDFRIDKFQVVYPFKFTFDYANIYTLAHCMIIMLCLIKIRRSWIYDFRIFVYSDNQVI